MIEYHTDKNHIVEVCAQVILNDSACLLTIQRIKKAEDTLKSSA